MGRRIHPVLYYGYELGCPQNEGWRVEEAVPNEHGYRALDKPWTRVIPGDDGLSMIWHLLIVSGVPGEEIRSEHWTQWEGMLGYRHTVKIVEYGYTNIPRYMLAAGVPGISPSDCPTPIRHNTHAKLKWALGALGITPYQKEPAWLPVRTYDEPEPGGPCACCGHNKCLRAKDEFRPESEIHAKLGNYVKWGVSDVVIPEQTDM
jgi:hypothetical protein